MGGMVRLTHAEQNITEGSATRHSHYSKGLLLWHQAWEAKGTGRTAC